MNTSQALLIYLIALIFIFAIFIHIRIKAISALILALLICQILLNIIHPPNTITPWSPDGESITSATALYVLIQIGTPLAVLVFVFIKCWNDRNII